MFRRSFAKEMFKAIGRMVARTVLLIVFLAVGLLFKTNDKVESRAGREPFPVNRVDYSVTLLENGDAQVSERWDVTFHEGDAERYRRSEGVDLKGHTMALAYDFETESGQWMEDVEVIENGVPLESSEGEGADLKGRYAVEDPWTGSIRRCVVRWGIPESGRNVYEVRYTLTDFLRRCDEKTVQNAVQYGGREVPGGGAAFSRRFFKPDVYLPGAITLAMDMQGKRLSDAAIYDCADGFRGMAGFTGGTYRLQTVGRLKGDDTVSVCMVFPEEVFSAEGEFDDYLLWHGPNSDSQKMPRSWTRGRTQRAALTAAAALLALLVAMTALYLLRVARRPTVSEGDDGLNEGELKQVRRLLPIPMALLLLIIVALILGGQYYYGSGFLIALMIAVPLWAALMALLGIWVNAGKAIRQKAIERLCA